MTDLPLTTAARWGVNRLSAIALGLAVMAGLLAFVATLSVLGRIEAERAEGRLALYASGIEAELGRVAHLPHILAQEGAVEAVAAGGDPEALNRRLADYAARARVDAIYLMDATGLTLAASNAGTTGSFVGQNYAFRPYFTDALAGDTGTFFGVGATTRRPGYFIAEPVQSAGGAVLGVMAVKLDLSRLEERWSAADEAVRVLNADGVTILTSRDDWRYRPAAPLDAAQRDQMTAARQFGATPPDGAVLPLPEAMLTRTMAAAPWTVAYAPGTGTAALWAFIAAGAVAAAVIFVSLVWAGRRALQATADLRRAEAKEATLRAMNTRLAEEVSERHAAEAKLRAAQAELVRAGRLAVLGRVAASVCHELGQPISAMRNYLHAERLSPKSDSALPQRLSGMVDRLDGITRQLRFFARADGPVMSSVPVADVLAYAVEVLSAEIDAAGARVEVPDTKALVRGDRGRLEQVVVNLLRNALDAEATVIRFGVAAEGDSVTLIIADSGPGLPVPFDQAAEPFFTTRASGQGTGLGLAISAEIIREHGGTMRADPSELGGAAFAVRLPAA